MWKHIAWKQYLYLLTDTWTIHTEPSEPSEASELKANRSARSTCHMSGTKHVPHVRHEARTTCQRQHVNVITLYQFSDRVMLLRKHHAGRGESILVPLRECENLLHSGHKTSNSQHEIRIAFSLVERNHYSSEKKWMTAISGRWPHVEHCRLIYSRFWKWRELVSRQRFLYFLSHNQA